jgi:hypothetical protein
VQEEEELEEEAAEEIWKSYRCKIHINFVMVDRRQKKTSTIEDRDRNPKGN